MLELFFLINFVINQKIRLFRYLYGIYCFVRLSKWSFARVLFASLFLVCSGCPKHIDQTNVDSMLKNFADGTIELGWNVGTPQYMLSREKMRHFYAVADWAALAKAVIEGNLFGSVEYYYLGRSAEGLGLYKAARIYYAKGLMYSDECKYLQGGCDGFSFPRDINVRIEALR
jgi:hypothetical protein